MTKIIPTGMRGKKIIPVGTKRECTRSVLVEVQVGLIAEKAARSFRSRCRPVLKCMVNRIKTPVLKFRRNGNCSKRTFQGRHHAPEHTKGYAEIPEGL